MNKLTTIELLEPRITKDGPIDAYMQPIEEGRYILLIDHIAAIKKPIQALAIISNLCKLDNAIGRKLDASEIGEIIWEATKLNHLELNDLLYDEDKT